MFNCVLLSLAIKAKQTEINWWSNLFWVGIKLNCAVKPLKEFFSEVIVRKGATNNCGHREVIALVTASHMVISEVIRLGAKSDCVYCKVNFLMFENLI